MLPEVAGHQVNRGAAAGGWQDQQRSGILRMENRDKCGHIFQKYVVQGWGGGNNQQHRGQFGWDTTSGRLRTCMPCKVQGELAAE